MEQRPKIKLQLSATGRILNILSNSLLIVMWILAIYFYLKLPEIIPVHFNLKGEADGYGKKISLLIMPAVATLIFIGISFLINRPHILNYLQKITIENAERQYSAATKMLRLLRLSVVIIFIIILFSIYLTSSGTIRALGTWLLPVILCLVFIPLISIPKTLKNK